MCRFETLETLLVDKFPRTHTDPDFDDFCRPFRDMDPTKLAKLQAKAAANRIGELPYSSHRSVH